MIDHREIYLAGHFKLYASLGRFNLIRFVRLRPDFFMH
jgi:hypothetical protein